MENLHKSKCLLRYLVKKQKMCKKNSQIATYYTFLKALNPSNSNVQKYLQP